MKRLLFVSVLLFSTLISYAQNWAPIGAKWTFGYAVAFSQTFGYTEWVSTKDTLVNSHNCRLIKRIGVCSSTDTTDHLITYEDSNRVYLYNSYYNQFTVLYDFNKLAGESWTMKIDTSDILITVNSTGMETYNGTPHKVLNITSEDYAFDGKIIQHFGHTSGPHPDVFYHCQHIAVDGLYYTGLRCYEDSIIGFINFGLVPDCYVSSIDEIQQNHNQVQILPNPFTAEATISTGYAFQNATLTVYNTLGQAIKQIPNISGTTIVLQRDNLPSGLYLLQLSQDNKTLVSSKIVITNN